MLTTPIAEGTSTSVGAAATADTLADTQGEFQDSTAVRKLLDYQLTNFWTKVSNYWTIDL
jgi:hypothetical protein